MVKVMEWILVTLLLGKLAYGYMHPTLDCDFREGICDWKQEDANILRWEWGKLYSWSYMPDDNGTSGNYLYVKTGYEFQSNVRQLRSVQLDQNFKGWLSFRYCMFSHKERFDSLDIYLKSAKLHGHRMLLWSITENQGNKWLDGKVCVYSDVSYTILIETRNHPNKWGIHGTIAVDDLKFNQTECEVKCTFEYGFCGWRQPDDSRNRYWRRQKDVGGYSLYLDGNSSATFESIDIYMDDFQCLTFLYDMSNADAGTIQVSVKENGKIIHLTTLSKSDYQKNSWIQAIVEIEVTSRTMVTLLLRGQTWNYAGIKLDNISITSGSCLDCTRYHAFCNWDGNSIWNINQKELFYANTNKTSMRNESVLTSKSETLPGKKCLSFPYYKDGNCTTYVQARSYEGVVLSNISTMLSDTNWTRNFISIDLPKKSRIAISFVHGRDCIGQYGIGAISLKQGLCREQTKTLSTELLTFATTTPTVSTIATTSADTATTTAATFTHINSTAAVATSVTTVSSERRTFMTPNNSTEESTKAPSRIISSFVTNTSTHISTIATTSTESMTTPASTTISINVTAVTAATSSTTVPDVTRTFTTPNDFTKAGALIGIVIGCLAIIVCVLLVAVCYYRRRRAFRTRTKAPKDGILSDETNRGVSRTNKNNNNVRPSSEGANQMSQTATVQKVQPKESKIPRRSVSGKISVPSLLNLLENNSSRTVTNPLQVNSRNRQNVDSEEDNHYDTTYDTKTPVPDNTYNHTTEFRNDTYDSMITCAKTTFNDTYDHTHFK